MIDKELLKLSNLQRRYADLLKEIQKVLSRMSENNGKADEADIKHLHITQKKMIQIETQMKKLGEKIKNRK